MWLQGYELSSWAQAFPNSPQLLGSEVSHSLFPSTRNFSYCMYHENKMNVKSLSIFLNKELATRWRWELEDRRVLDSNVLRRITPWERYEGNSYRTGLNKKWTYWFFDEVRCYFQGKRMRTSPVRVTHPMHLARKKISDRSVSYFIRWIKRSLIKNKEEEVPTWMLCWSQMLEGRSYPSSILHLRSINFQPKFEHSKCPGIIQQ